MKRIAVIGLLVVGVACIGHTTTSPASAAWICLPALIGWYELDGGIGQECNNKRILPRFGYGLFQRNGSKELAPGVLCALVDNGPSSYNGPGCGPTEEHKGEDEYAKAYIKAFLWSGAGGAVLLAKAANTQVFTTAAGNIECTAVKFQGSVKEPLVVPEMLKGSYTGCTAFGIAASFSEAQYELSALGSLTVTGKTIAISIAALGCTIKVAPITANAGLKTVKFLNDVGQVLAKLEITKLTVFVEGGGGICGATGTEKEAKYSGLLQVSGDGAGTIAWE